MSAPTPNLINVLPDPTKISPLVYELYPVPPYKAVITPLFTTIPERLEGTKLVRNKLPPIPTPPVTINAPEVADVEDVEEVIAKPDADNMFVDGLNEIVVLEDTATPEPVAVGLKCIGCAEPLIALFTFIFAAVVANPDVSP